MKRGLYFAFIALFLILIFSFVAAEVFHPAEKVKVNVDGTSKTLNEGAENFRGRHNYVSPSLSSLGIGEHEASQIWVAVEDGEKTLIAALQTDSKLCAGTNKPADSSGYSSFPAGENNVAFHYATEIQLASGKTLQASINDGDVCGCVPEQPRTIDCDCTSCPTPDEACRDYHDIIQTCQTAGLWSEEICNSYTDTTPGTGSCPAPPATCIDGVQNGDETGEDCGGSCPNSCGGNNPDDGGGDQDCGSNHVNCTQQRAYFVKSGTEERWYISKVCNGNGVCVWPSGSGIAGDVYITGADIDGSSCSVAGGSCKSSCGLNQIAYVSDCNYNQVCCRKKADVRTCTSHADCSLYYYCNSFGVCVSSTDYEYELPVTCEYASEVCKNTKITCSDGSLGGYGSKNCDGGGTTVTCSPDPSTVCSGTSFRYTCTDESSGYETGTKNCDGGGTTVTCSPDPSTVCSGTSFRYTCTDESSGYETGTKNCGGSSSTLACGSGGSYCPPSTETCAASTHCDSSFPSGPTCVTVVKENCI